MFGFVVTDGLNRNFRQVSIGLVQPVRTLYKITFTNVNQMIELMAVARSGRGRVSLEISSTSISWKFFYSQFTYCNIRIKRLHFTIAFQCLCLRVALETLRIFFHF